MQVQTTRGMIETGQDVTYKGQPATVTHIEAPTGSSPVLFLDVNGTRELCMAYDPDLTLGGSAS
jgi:hypothetical protein